MRVNDKNCSSPYFFHLPPVSFLPSRYSLCSLLTRIWHVLLFGDPLHPTHCGRHILKPPFASSPLLFCSATKADPSLHVVFLEHSQDTQICRKWAKVSENATPAAMKKIHQPNGHGIIDILNDLIILSQWKPRVQVSDRPRAFELEVALFRFLRIAIGRI